jgi:monoamine oxidase
MSLTRRAFLASTAATATAASLPNLAYTAAAAPPDVIVIGAGLSGLETANTLEENGLKVLLLEGRRDRVGGRVYSLFNLPGHPEVGGNSIATGYGRMIAAAAKYGVEIVNVAPRVLGKGGQELYLDGVHVPLADWPRHPRNPFADSMREVPPWAWPNAMFTKYMPFRDLESWSDPKYSKYDISVHDFLASQGASEAAINLGYNTNIGYGTTAYDVSLLTQAFSDYWQAVNKGVLFGNLLTPGQGPAASHGPPGAFVGVMKDGNQNLPIAMARHFKGERLMGKQVVAIDVEPAGGAVICADGSRYRARAIVCSMPFATLRNVAIHPTLPAMQAKAVATLGYIPITQFHLIPKRPFWDSDGLGPSMWTDSTAGSVLAQRFGRTDDEVTSLTCWSRGARALEIDRLGVEGGSRAVLADLARLRPASKGALEVGAVHSWSLDPFNAGDWAIYGPGQVTQFSHLLANPHQRLFFCGEHTSVASRGMEGALESAERVSLEVLTALA